MGTLGCINDMMRRDKENRELRNRNRERINDTRNRLIEVGKKRELPDMSAGSIDHIRKNTVEKERADNDKLFRLKLKFAVIVGVALLLCYVAYVDLFYGLFCCAFQFEFHDVDIVVCLHNHVYASG